MEGERQHWDRRYATGDHPSGEQPVPGLEHVVEHQGGGRALDVATGAGRNALYLADHGYDVDAVDVSREGLEIASERAEDRDLTVNWIHADVDSYVFPRRTYDLVSIGYYYNMNRFSGIKDAVAEGGYLVYRHHLKTDADDARGPDDPSVRMESNELLHALLGMTVVLYREERTTTETGRADATVTAVARREGG